MQTIEKHLLHLIYLFSEFFTIYCMEMSINVQSKNAQKTGLSSSVFSFMK